MPLISAHTRATGYLSFVAEVPAFAGTSGASRVLTCYRDMAEGNSAAEWVLGVDIAT
jgi:hypothetical protein